jgi:hypothetical protein
VLYQPNLLQIRRPEDVNLDLVGRLFRTTHESWSYEQELRMFVQLNDPPDAKGLHWVDFGPDLVLSEIIIGAQCSPKDSKDAEGRYRDIRAFSRMFFGRACAQTLFTGQAAPCAALARFGEVNGLRFIPHSHVFIIAACRESAMRYSSRLLIIRLLQHAPIGSV